MIFLFQFDRTIVRTPRGLEDVSKYPELFAELLRSGKWNVHDLKKVAGLNLLRVFRKVIPFDYPVRRKASNVDLKLLLP